MGRFIQRVATEFDIGEGRALRRYILLAGCVLYVGCQIAYFAVPPWSPLRGTSLTFSTILSTLWIVDIFVQHRSRTWIWRTFRDNAVGRLIILASVVLALAGQIGVWRSDGRLVISSALAYSGLVVPVGGYYFFGRYGAQIWQFVLSLRRP